MWVADDVCWCMGSGCHGQTCILFLSYFFNLAIFTISVSHFFLLCIGAYLLCERRLCVEVMYHIPKR